MKNKTMKLTGLLAAAVGCERTGDAGAPVDDLSTTTTTVPLDTGAPTTSTPTGRAAGRNRSAIRWIPRAARGINRTAGTSTCRWLT